MTPEHASAPALGAGAVDGNHRGSPTHEHLTEPTPIGALLPTATMSVLIAENIAKGTIDYPDSEADQ